VWLGYSFSLREKEFAIGGKEQVQIARLNSKSSKAFLRGEKILLEEIFWGVSTHGDLVFFLSEKEKECW